MAMIDTHREKTYHEALLTYLITHYGGEYYC